MYELNKLKKELEFLNVWPYTILQIERLRVETKQRKGMKMNDFNKETMNRLNKKGIRLVGLQAIPRNNSWLNADRGYVLDDNGTCKIVLFLEVLNLAKQA